VNRKPASNPITTIDWDILTVADDADDDYFGNSTLGVREQQWRLLFPHVVKTGAAFLHEFYLLTR
jgi:hypothetical protein